MNCPNCGRPETARVKVCPACNEAYASQDLMALRQLEFLVQETAAWENVGALRAPYLQKLDALRGRLVRKAPEPEPEPAAEVVPAVEAVPEVLPAEAAEPEPEVAPTLEPVVVPAAELAPETAGAVPAPEAKSMPVAEPAERVPFDQWLLSERNIKIALYGGALLLVIAGIIFVGVNWARIAGPAKFAITVMVTGLTVLGGYLLFQRPAMKLGGVAVLGVACGFMALNFVVLQIYVLGPRGLREDVMWLIASPLCLIAYLVLAYWTRGDLFTYIGLGAVASTAAAALTVANASDGVIVLTATLLLTGFLALAWRLRTTNLADFTYRPLLIVIQGATPLALLIALVIWASESASSLHPEEPWLALAALAVGVLFYAGTDWVHRQLAARWGATALFDLAFTLALIEAGADDTTAGLVLMVLALVQLLIGRRLLVREEGMPGAVPLFFTATLLALLVTGMALEDQESLIKVLLGDVVLLGVAAWIFPRRGFEYGAAWLFMLPVYLLLDLTFVSLVTRGLLMGLLGAIYGGAGTAFVLRKEERLGWPTLSAAAFLSVVTVGLTWDEPAVASLVLLGLVVAYLAAAEWLKWPWLMVPVYITIWTLMLSVYTLLDLTVARIVYRGLLMGLLGAIYGGVGAAFVLRNKERLGWPFLSAAALLSVVTVALTWEVPAVASLVLLGLIAVYLVVAEWLRWPWLMVPVYITVWTLMLSVYTLLEETVRRPVYQGLLLGLLGLNYVAAGYGLARRARRLAWPFLTAAAFLSAAIIPMIWEIPPVAGLVLAAVAVLYTLVAIWLNWSWLLLPGLAAVNLAVLAANLSFYQPRRGTEGALLISCMLLGMVLCGGALALKRNKLGKWSWPLYLVGAIDVVLALAGGFAAGGWLAVGLATAGAATLLAFAWWEREPLAQLEFSPLVGVAIGVIFADFIFLLDALGGRATMEIWPTYTAGLCALFVLLGWLLRREPWGPIYGAPLRYAGLGLMVIPAVGAVVTLELAFMAVTYAIAALTYAGEAAARRILNLAYLALAITVAVIWMVLGAVDVSEMQAYAAPLGVALLGAGWNQRRRQRKGTYVWPSVAGLLVLMGSAFVQSLDYRGEVYAVLLLVESLLSIAWGIRSQARCFCQVGGVALLLNSVVQLGPGFMDLTRWIQIGITGAILLGGGLLALFKRDEILNTRQRLTEQWRQWGP